MFNQCKVAIDHFHLIKNEFDGDERKVNVPYRYYNGSYIIIEVDLFFTKKEWNDGVYLKMIYPSNRVVVVVVISYVSTQITRDTTLSSTSIEKEIL